MYYAPKCLHHLAEQHWIDLKKHGFPIPKDKKKLEATLAALDAPEDIVNEQFLRDVDELLHLATTDLGVILGSADSERGAELAE